MRTNKENINKFGILLNVIYRGEGIYQLLQKKSAVKKVYIQRTSFFPDDRNFSQPVRSFAVNKCFLATPKN